MTLDQVPLAWQVALGAPAVPAAQLAVHTLPTAVVAPQEKEALAGLPAGLPVHPVLGAGSEACAAALSCLRRAADEETGRAAHTLAHQ